MRPVAQPHSPALGYLPHKLPVLTVDYEGSDASEFDNTEHSILDFLELPRERVRKHQVERVPT